jgi:DNA-binding NtrC family response regulator
MKRLRSTIRQIGRSRATSIVLFGESGTGKGLVARALHEESLRRNRPFVSLTCSAIPEQLLESELFGHEAGAYTDGRERKVGLLEAANGGTLLLDEIGDMAPMLQAKLLGVLEDRVVRRLGGVAEIPVDLRVTSATNRDLATMVREGTFREDLLHRLCVIPIDLPPLREHAEDIPELVDHFVTLFVGEEGHGVEVTQEAGEFLASLPWRGNARELRNAVERALTLCPDATLDVSAFAWKAEDRGTPYPLPREGLDIERVIDGLVQSALQRTQGNQTAAAGLLGMTRNQLRYRMTKMGLLTTAAAQAPRPRRGACGA